MSGVCVYQVRIKPLEPLMLRGSGEFDPSARGVTSTAISQAWPSPSTITGLLCATLLRQPQQRNSSWSGYVSNMNRILSSVGIEWVRGPYILRGETTYVPILLRGRLHLIDYLQLKYSFGRYRDCLLGDDLESFAESLEKLTDIKAEPIFQERIGIALKSREGLKTVREGYLYAATYVALGNASIAVEVGSTSPLQRLNETVAVLGGEGRVVKLEVVEAEQRKTITSLALKEGYAVLLSPLVVPGPPMKILREGGVVYVEVEGKRLIRMVSGLVGLKGLGFSIVDRSRKPVYPAIYEGSIVKVEEFVGDTRRYGMYACVQNPTPIIELLGRVGYGSYAPLL